MTRLLACTVERPIDAQKIIGQLTRDCMCDRADISLIVRDENTWVAQTAAKGASALKEVVGAGAGALSSTFQALFEGVDAVSQMVPGGAMLRAAGEFGVKVARTGAATGAELAGALIDAGVPKSEAQRYGKAFEQGGILLTAHVKTDKSAQCARKVMMAHGAAVTEVA